MSTTTISSKTVRRTVTSGGDVHESVTHSSDTSSNYQVYRGLSPSSQSRIENRVKELEDALEHERSAHGRSHKQLTDLQVRVQTLQEKLEDAEREISTQINAVRIRDGEVLQIKKDTEMSIAQYEANETSLKKRFQDQINDLTDQLERMVKAKSKVEKEKQLLALEVESFPEKFEEINKAKSYAELKYDNLDEQARRLRQQNDELTRINQELTAARQRSTQENADLQSRVKDLEAKYKAAMLEKTQIQQKFDSTQTKLDEEIRIYVHLEAQYAKVTADFEQLKSDTHDTADKISKLQEELQRALSEGNSARIYYEKDLAAIKEESEETRRKLSSRLIELESQLEQFRGKASRLEKEKHKLTITIEELTHTCELTNASVSEQEKLVKQAEANVLSLQKRITELTAELQSAQNDTKRVQAELVQVKQALTDQQQRNEAVVRESRGLSDSLHAVELKVKELTRQEQELQSIRTQLISERDLFRTQLNESVDHVHNLEVQLEAANNQINQLRLDIDSVTYAKNDELEGERRTSKRTIDELTYSLTEIDNRLKVEITRWKKKLDSEREEFLLQIETISKTNQDLTKHNKTLAVKVKDLEALLDAERLTVEQLNQSVSAAERKFVMQQSEVEELRLQLTAAYNARKIVEAEKADVVGRIDEISVVVQTLTNEKRRVESDLEETRRRYDSANTARLAAEEQVDKLSSNLKKLHDQLRQEQANTANAESRNKQLEAKIREQLVTIEQFEAQKDNKRQLAKLQSQVHDLHADLELEQRHGREYVAEIKKIERLLSEAKLQLEAERHTVAQQAETISSFEEKFAALKRQLKSSEEMLSITVNKYRKTQQLLDEAERRADKGLSLITSATLSSSSGATSRTSSSSTSVRRRSYSVHRETSSSSKLTSY